ncbi:MAG TPA: UDP-glucose/GDP-mannose dehydrogenase family protein [Gemmatimonadetes bacterium]|jgi:UDPglucose 6-dehydrogenase|nr:UDP-glucose/GDP-mannose dehydrogenase family protein [Gemmatimonadota bacterium]
MRIGVIGTGYVGLVTGACFAEIGQSVLCGDVDQTKISQLKLGVMPIYEPGLAELVRGNMDAERLDFTSDLAEIARTADVIFIAVGTPQNRDGSADISNILEVSRIIGKEMKGEKIVVTKSTVPVGTSEKIRDTIESLSEFKVHVCSNPEFLREGSAVSDFTNPDRVILGVDNKYAESCLKDLYGSFMKNTEVILVMDLASAEMTKYAANAMLATRISFINSIAAFCKKKNADIQMVRKGIGSDHRIGLDYLNPGVGYGGSCFSKDMKALIKMMSDLDLNPSILLAVEELNEDQKTILFHEVIGRFGNDLTDKKIAIWGLSFKPDTGDMREAPSLATIEALLAHGASVSAHDPRAIKEAKQRFGTRISLCEDQYEVLNDASALVVHTEWDCYRHPDFEKVKSKMREAVVIDGRNLYNSNWLVSQGFEYYSVATSD